MEISISLKNNNDAEQRTKEMLEGIFKKYSLDKWIRCREVLIEQGAGGKAFPVVRLSAWRSDSEDSLLAQFIHEQYHWIEDGKEGQMKEAIEVLKTIFPNAPLERPEGGGGEKSTYCHLIVCRLELLALSELLGTEKAHAIVSGNPNYTWIRRMVIERASDIDPIIEKYFPGVLQR